MRQYVSPRPPPSVGGLPFFRPGDPGFKMGTTARPLRYVLALLLNAALSVGVFSQQAGAPPVVTTGAGGVVLHVTLTRGAAGGYASGVDKRSFVVLDEKAPQEITLFQDGAVPASIGILLETSERLNLDYRAKGKTLPEMMAEGLSEFSVMGSQGNDYFVMGFGERPQLLLDWTRDLASAESAVASVRQKGGAGALYDACFAALDKLAQGKSRKRVLLVISGGPDNKSRHKFNELLRRLNETDALVYVVGAGDFHGDMQWRSEAARAVIATGGRARFPFDAMTVKDTFAQLALELQRQYLIGFEPAGGAPDGKFHRLEVRLKPVGNTEKELKGLHVRGREGYVAMSR